VVVKAVAVYGVTPLGSSRADREPPTAFSLRFENVRITHPSSEKTNVVVPIIVLRCTNPPPVSAHDL
jgi:hypothetical protein